MNYFMIGVKLGLFKLYWERGEYLNGNNDEKW